MPAARQRSRSPFIACAVIATMRMWPPVDALARRMAAVASSPPISGICTSISTTSKVLALELGERLQPVVGDGDLVSALREQPHRDALVDDVVFRQQHLEARAAARRASDGLVGATPPAPSTCD